MQMHELYWRLQELLQEAGMVRLSREMPRDKEVEVWVHPDEGMRLELSSTPASKLELRRAESFKA